MTGKGGYGKQTVESAFLAYLKPLAEHGGPGSPSPEVVMQPVGRRFPDGRSAVARRWAAVRAAIEATYPPSTGLDRILTAMATDVILDYQDLRAEPDPDQKRASSRRKTLGLALSVLGKLERLRQGANGDQARSAEALQAILAKVQAARQGGS